MAAVLFTALAGVLAGAFVVDLTSPHGLVWARFYRVWTFYGLCLLALAQYCYQKALFAHETSIANFRDVGYCEAFMVSQCLPEVARQAKQKIRNGEGGEFKQAMDEIRKVIK